jgi:type VI protein secretion system component VasK
LDELGGILRPKTGSLWTFYDSTLKNIMPCQNGECTPKGTPPLNPQFPRFIGQMMKFSTALYGEAGTEPNLRYTLKPQASDQIEEFTVTVNGQPATMKGGAQQPFVWPGQGTRSFRLSLKLAGGTSIDVEPGEGLWSVFRFFADADSSRQTPAGYNFGFVVRQGRAAKPMEVKGRALTYDFIVDTGGGPAVFSKDFLTTLKCVTPVAR